MNDEREHYPAELDRRILSALLDMADEHDAGFDEDLVARFACGWVTEEERDQAISLFAHSDAARARLIEMRNRLQTATQAAVAEDATLSGAVRKAAGALISAGIRWRRLCEESLRGAVLSAEQRRSFQATFSQLMAGIEASRPPVAYARSAAPKLQVYVYPSGPNVELTISKGVDGIVASVDFEPGATVPEELTLTLGVPGTESLYCGTAPVIDGSWRLQIPNPPARLADLDLAGAPFGLIAGGDTMPPPITVDVQDRDQVVTAWVRPTAPPHVENGELRLSISIPPDLRAQWAGRTLSLTVRVAGVRLVVGRWAVDELPQEEVIELRAPLEGAEDGKLELTSILLLELSR